MIEGFLCIYQSGGILWQKQQISIYRLQLAKVFCNQCGKELVVQDGILKEGCFSVDYPFDYFSNKDGYIYNLDLCEECFDKWNSQFTIPVQIEETKEFL